MHNTENIQKIQFHIKQENLEAKQNCLMSIRYCPLNEKINNCEEKLEE